MMKTDHRICVPVRSAEGGGGDSGEFSSSTLISCAVVRRTLHT
jgi:hypothetical protein